MFFLHTKGVVLDKLFLRLGFLCIIFLFFVRTTFAAYYTTQINSSTYRNLGTPEGIIRLADGNMWYADSANYRIVKISPTGTILRTVGRQGTDEGEFVNIVKAITKDEVGNLYVLDYCHIYKLDQYGGYQTSWGSCGDGDGQFSNAVGIHYTDTNGTLIVSDTGHDRIIRFNTEGNFVDQFGVSGTGDGELNQPWGVTTNSTGNIYVIDSGNHRIQVFNDEGAYLSQFGGSAPGDFELVFPKDIEILSNGDLVVTSQNSQTVKKFNSTGTALLDSWGSNGTANDQFQYPQFLAVDSSDDSLWVTDWGLKRIQHFASDGTYMSIIQNSGTGNGQFITPYDVDFDATGNMYVLDSTNRVQKFDSSGNYTSTVIASGVITDSAVYHLTVSTGSGNILVSTETNVLVFNSSGTLLNSLGNHGVNGANSGTGDFNNARGMDIDSSENVYVTDLLNNRVQKFNLTNVADGGFDGGFVTSWAVEYPEEIVYSNGFVYVASPSPTGIPEELKIRKYTTNGDFQEVFLDQWGVDVDTQYYLNKGVAMHVGKTYITDPNNDRIMVYNSDGSFAEKIGEHGSGTEQFDGITSAKFNHVTGDLVVVDTFNHRVQIMVNGVKINNLNPSADVINSDNSLSIAKKAIDPNGENTDSLTAKLYFGDYIVSDFVVDLTQNRNWENVNTILLPDESKSLVVNLNPTDAPGISPTHSLYIVKATGQNSVRVCTDATLIADVNSSCTGYVLTDGDTGLSSVNIGGVDYWKVTGLTGTGAMGTTVSVTPTPGGGSSQSSKSGNSSGGSSTSTPGCSSEEVAGTPDLFQINTLGTSAKLFFTPISNTNSFYFSFSTKPNVFEHGTIATLAKEGVQSFTISHLKPNTNYYFKVRGQSGCKPGSWSNTMQIKTQGLGARRNIAFYKYYQPLFTSVHSSPVERTGATRVTPQVSISPKIETIIEPSVTPYTEPEVVTPTSIKQSTPITQPISPPAKKCYLWGLFCW